MAASTMVVVSDILEKCTSSIFLKTKFSDQSFFSRFFVFFNRRDNSVIGVSYSWMCQHLKQGNPFKNRLVLTPQKKIFVNIEIQQLQYKSYVNRGWSLYRVNHMPDLFKTDKFAPSQLSLYILVALWCSR